MACASFEDVEEGTVAAGAEVGDGHSMYWGGGLGRVGIGVWEGLVGMRVGLWLGFGEAF